jgi:hypothetical protein
MVTKYRDVRDEGYPRGTQLSMFNIHPLQFKNSNSSCALKTDGLHTAKSQELRVTHLTGNTLRLGYEPNRLMLNIGDDEVEVNLRPTVSRPVCLGVGLPSGAHDQIFVFCLMIAGFLMCGTLSD